MKLKERIKELLGLSVIFIGVVIVGVMFQAVVDTLYEFYCLLGF